ncbi:hypothetical protein EDB80DRAFT_692026 [Ilyonectria destructans]|nr:hypothetical protein EDB80DRAFT_692026 [Ilyonectria destructans]
MPRVKGFSLEQCAAYQEYVNGEPGPDGAGTRKRWDREVAFHRDEQGRILVPLGELYCRMPTTSKGLCHQNNMFTHTSNLKVHIRSCHKAEVGETHRGASSMEESIAAMKYWTAHLAYLKGNSQDLTVPTPQKGSQISAPTVPTVTVYDIKDLDVPRYKTGGKGYKKGDPWVKKMKLEAGIAAKDSCYACEEKGQASGEAVVWPPPEASKDCALWAFFINKLETVLVSDDEPEEEDVEV